MSYFPMIYWETSVKPASGSEVIHMQDKCSGLNSNAHNKDSFHGLRASALLFGLFFVLP